VRPGASFLRPRAKPGAQNPFGVKNLLDPLALQLIEFCVNVNHVKFSCHFTDVSVVCVPSGNLQSPIMAIGRLEHFKRSFPTIWTARICRTLLRLRFWDSRAKHVAITYWPFTYNLGLSCTHCTVLTRERGTRAYWQSSCSSWIQRQQDV
jgi:hypothetical protein